MAESSLRLDREAKGSLYARAGITDCWIVNLVAHVVEVSRDPRPDPDAPYGWSSGARESLDETATVARLAVPAARIVVSQLLP